MAVHVPEHKTDDGKYKKTEVEDSCSFLGEITNGAQVIFQVSSVTPCDRLIRLEVYGDEGVLGAQVVSRDQDYYGRLLARFIHQSNWNRRLRRLFSPIKGWRN